MLDLLADADFTNQEKEKLADWWNRLKSGAAKMLQFDQSSLR